jgi:hypothetical protein
LVALFLFLAGCWFGGRVALVGSSGLFRLVTVVLLGLMVWFVGFFGLFG